MLKYVVYRFASYIPFIYGINIQYSDYFYSGDGSHCQYNAAGMCFRTVDQHFCTDVLHNDLNWSTVTSTHLHLSEARERRNEPCSYKVHIILHEGRCRTSVGNDDVWRHWRCGHDWSIVCEVKRCVVIIADKKLKNISSS